MDRRQRNFLIIIAAFVALFTLVLVVINLTQKETAPGPLVTPTPGQTATRVTIQPSPTPSTALATPTKSPTATQTKPGVTPSKTTRTQPQAFFASPNGSEQNSGSKDSPWPLQYVLDGKAPIIPGDTIWLLGGTYEGPFISQLSGAEGKPITIRAIPGQRVILTSSKLVMDIQTSAYVNFWGFEITSSNNLRDPNNPQSSSYGIRINQGETSHDIKFINLIVHDMPTQGFGWWQANMDSEIYGCLVYFNGVTQFDHGIYVHNTDGKKSIVDNIIFDNASHGIHAYGEKDYQKLNNITIEGNTVFDNGSIGYSTSLKQWGKYGRNILIGGYLVAENPVIIDNYTYYPNMSGIDFNLGYRAGSTNALVENNYFAGGKIELGGQNQSMTMLQNTIMGFGLASIQNFSAGMGQNNLLTFKPTDEKIFVRPNQYEPGRANITIYNWQRANEVTLSAQDLNGVQIKKGDAYELHNVQDYFGDVTTGTYDGNRIIIPMTGRSVAQPVNLSFKPPSTFPEFGAFVLVVPGTVQP